MAIWKSPPGSLIHPDILYLWFENLVKKKNLASCILQDEAMKREEEKEDKHFILSVCLTLEKICSPESIIITPCIW